MPVATSDSQVSCLFKHVVVLFSCIKISKGNPLVVLIRTGFPCVRLTSNLPTNITRTNIA